MRSIFDSVDVAKAVGPNRVTGTGSPVAAFIHTVDTFGYSTGMFDIAIGSPTGTPCGLTVQVQVQECATTTGTFTDVSGVTGTATGTSTSGNYNVQVRVEGLGTSRQRYLRIIPVLTMAPNTGTNYHISAVALLARGYQNPVSNSASVAV